MAYHHGDLLTALTAVAVELATEGGPDAVVLREAARRVGVSPAAAYRHVADRAALLDLVAVGAGAQLVARMRRDQAAVRAHDPREAALLRFRATGAAYVGFALAQPGLFRTALMARPSGAAGLLDGAPGRVLAEALDGVVAVGLLAPAARPRSETVAWAAVHGLAVLLLDGLLPPGDADAVRDDVPGGVLDRLLEAVAFGLLAPR